MKKTLTINLNSIAFHIDDDAYEMLRKYLNEISDHFKSEGERKEIMADVEARIAELFTEKLQAGKNVITIEEVKFVVEIMGNPSQYTDEEDENTNESHKSYQHTEYRSKKLYRDVLNAKMGGVASGLGAYLNMDLTLLRILLILLIFLTNGAVVLIYVICWIVIPAALTASQRLEMQGEQVTVENIKSEFKSTSLNDKYTQSSSPVGSRFGEVVYKVIKGLAIAFATFIGIVGLIIVASLLVGLISLAFGTSLVSFMFPQVFNELSFLTPELIVLYLVSFILIVGCPVTAIIYYLLRRKTNVSKSSKAFPWIMFVLWLSGIFMLISVSVKIYASHPNELKHFSVNFPSILNSNLKFGGGMSRKNITYNYINIKNIEAEDVELIIKNGNESGVQIEEDVNNRDNVVVDLKDNTLTIKPVHSSFGKRATVVVQSDSLSFIKLTRASILSTESEYTTPILNIDISGASKADLNSNVNKNLTCKVSGGSNLSIQGKGSNANFYASGASNIDAEEFLSDSINVETVGRSHANVNGYKYLRMKAVGMSYIAYTGNPHKIEKSTMGLSTIEKDY